MSAMSIKTLVAAYAHNLHDGYDLCRQWAMASVPKYQRAVVQCWLIDCMHAAANGQTDDASVGASWLAEFKRLTKRPTVGGYMAESGYTDVYPYEVVGVSKSGKTAKVRRLTATLDTVNGPKPEIIPGGFAGHCTNNRDLKYTFATDPDAPIQTVRLTKRGWGHGSFYVTDEPQHFHDYNF